MNYFQLLLVFPLRANLSFYPTVSEMQNLFFLNLCSKQLNSKVTACWHSSARHPWRFPTPPLFPCPAVDPPSADPTGPLVHWFTGCGTCHSSPLFSVPPLFLPLSLFLSLSLFTGLFVSYKSHNVMGWPFPSSNPTFALRSDANTSRWTCCKIKFYLLLSIPLLKPETCSFPISNSDTKFPIWVMHLGPSLWMLYYRICREVWRRETRTRRKTGSQTPDLVPGHPPTSAEVLRRSSW